MSSEPTQEELAKPQAPPGAGQSKSILPYLVILVAAAFLLLFMAYLMQQRTAESVQGLNQSVNSIHTIDQLVDDNRTLHQQVSQLQEELAQSEKLRESLESQLHAAQERQSQLQSELNIVRQQLAEATAPPEETPEQAP